jgi:hypothetical protein
VEHANVIELNHGLLQPRLDRTGGIPHVVDDHIEEEFALVQLGLQVHNFLLSLLSHKAKLAELMG